jgi:cholesterol transport system auxiliary component
MARNHGIGRFGAWLLAGLLLGACAELPKAPPAKAVYDFGLPAERLAGLADLGEVVLVVGSPPWMDEHDMLYRLSWDNPQLRRSYATSRWAASPSQLLALRWRQRLGLAQPAEGGHCQLRVRVDEFSQVFASPEQSSALLQAAAILVDARGRVLARHLLALRAEAGVDGRSGAAALADVADRAAGDLRQWLGEAPAAACFAAS